LIKFLLHYFTSNTRHGTHSPFVYALADEVIYNKKYLNSVKQNYDLQRFSGKYDRLLQAILTYLQIDQLIFDQYRSMSDKRLALLKDAEQIDANEVSLLTSNDVLIVSGIYESTKAQQQWKTLKSNPNVHVTIDLYYFGLVFYRPQQRKEDFKLKYPFWI